MHDMQAAVKVRVEHGQLVVDEPATLPEGSRWKLVPLDSLEEAMGPEEYAEFCASSRFPRRERKPVNSSMLMKCWPSSEPRREGQVYAAG